MGTRIKFENSDELASMVSADEVEAEAEEVPANVLFEASCMPLHELLLAGVPGARGDIARGIRPVIDLLSVDAEGAEIEILRDFPLELWDIRAVVIETSRRTSMGIDSLLLPGGLLKVAVLGKDAVYVSRPQASALPPTGPVLPDRIHWNEPGTDEDTTAYRRFQRLFGVEGDLDVDVGDQRLQNETELARQQARLDAANAVNAEKVLQRAQAATVGGLISAEQRQTLELPWVKDAMREPAVKSSLALLAQDEEAFLQELVGNKRLRAKITDLIEAGALVHARTSAFLGMEPPSVASPTRPL